MAAQIPQRSRGFSANVAHLINALLHGAASALVCSVAAVCCVRERDPLKVLVALMCGVLFATHPIHTEAVNNIVGRAEILSAILILGAALVRRRGRIVGQLASAIMYFASMLCKETACTFLGILGLSGLFSIASGHRSHRYKDTLHRVLKLAADVLPECCAFGAYIILRFFGSRYKLKMRSR